MTNIEEEHSLAGSYSSSIQDSRNQQELSYSLLGDFGTE
jgi:hypothetical protein